MASSLGFVVLARRPMRKLAEPGYVEGRYEYEPVSAVFPEYPNGLEQAQNALDFYSQRPVGPLHGIPLDVEGYVIGEITERTP